MHIYEHACCATQGAREYQEDMAAFLVVPASEPQAAEGDGPAPKAGALVAVLADGMGGHAAGDVASKTVCEEFLAAYDACAAETATTDRLMIALDSSNEAVAAMVEKDPLLSGMGSTVVGTVFGPEGIEWISVGDSPLYLYRRGEIAALNEDHSLAPELDRLAEAGRMTRHAALNDPRRHMLRSAVTGEEIAMCDLSRQPTALYEGDYVILASDGLQTLEPEEIGRVIAAYADSGPAVVAEALIRAVELMRQPHQDNATVIAVRPVFLK